MTTRREFFLSGAVLVAGAAMSTGEGRTFTGARPAEVLIMRHAEEPDRGSDVHLSDRGRRRAAALAGLFPGRFATPRFLFCARSSSKSHRPMETIQPLATALGLAIDDRFADEQFKAIAGTILTKPVYDGARILICWHHGEIPELAAALGVVKPPRWPVKQYDHVWRLHFDARAVTLTDEPERLLPGDSRRPA